MDTLDYMNLQSLFQVKGPLRKELYGMEVHLISSLLFFLGRCSATTSGDVTPSFMAGLIMPNQSMKLEDYDEIERDLYPLQRFKREGSFFFDLLLLIITLYAQKPIHCGTALFSVLPLGPVARTRLILETNMTLP